MGGHGNMSKKFMKKKKGKAVKLWVKTDKDLLKSVRVVVGISDGSYTEIVKGDVTEGMEIVTAVMKKSVANKMTNPFGRSRRRR